MKCSETELTEATKVISYLRSVRVYAVILMCATLVYPALRVGTGAKGAELYFLLCFSAIVLLGSLSVIARLNRKTVFVYGISSILAGVIYLFSIFYYKSRVQFFFMVPGLVLGIMTIRQGMDAAFGRRSQDAFSKANQEKISFINEVLGALKKSPPDENTIQCISDDNGEIKGLSIKFIDNMACFLLKGERTPLFVERGDVYILEIRSSPEAIRVCITLYNNEWLEADFTPEDFKRYETWKGV
jgi:uncharacterized membrane protein